jgi:hypothetical protein
MATGSEGRLHCRGHVSYLSAARILVGSVRTTEPPDVAEYHEAPKAFGPGIYTVRAGGADGRIAIAHSMISDGARFARCRRVRAPALAAVMRLPRRSTAIRALGRTT